MSNLAKYLPQNQHLRNYWLSQLLGWFVICSFNLFVVFIVDRFEWIHLLSFAAFSFIGFLTTHLFRHYIKRWGWLSYNIPRILVRIIPSTFILSIIWFSLFMALDYLIDPPTEEQKEKLLVVYIISIFNSWVILTGWTSLYFGFHFFRNYKQAEIDKWKLESTVKEAELLALKSQINPHFLFNSLNNIRSLIAENPDKARDMITHLSELLRYSIQLNHAEKVTLEKEIEVVQDYLQLESIQYEERLNYDFEIDQQLLHIQIPPMVIQTLVENAIKHGIAHLPEGGEIRIQANRIQDFLEIKVVNSGQIHESPFSTGIGLKNASQRLKLLTNSIQSIELENQSNNQVVARFRVPLQSQLIDISEMKEV